MATKPTIESLREQITATQTEITAIGQAPLPLARPRRTSARSSMQRPRDTFPPSKCSRAILIRSPTCCRS